MGLLELPPTHFGFEHSLEKGCNSQACSHRTRWEVHKLLSCKMNLKSGIHLKDRTLCL